VGSNVLGGLKLAGGAAVAGAPRRALIVAAIGACGAAIALLPMRLCFSAVLFHIPCPGCGMTRAALALFRGDWPAALALHPLSILVVPLGAVLAFEHAFRYAWSGRAFASSSRWREATLVAVAVLLVAVWIGRFFGWFGGPVPI
jgi:hypothetical protein